jgi:hypothetical protein
MLLPTLIIAFDSCVKLSTGSHMAAGNRPEELPEVVLGAARVYRVDLNQPWPFPEAAAEVLAAETDAEAPTPEAAAAAMAIPMATCLEAAAATLRLSSHRLLTSSTVDGSSHSELAALNVAVRGGDAESEEPPVPDGGEAPAAESASAIGA